jgi:hypothetical protein
MVTLEMMEQGLAHILGSPRAEARLEMVAWSVRPRPNPDAEVTLMDARCIVLLEGAPERWSLAGDRVVKAASAALEAASA